MKVEAMCPPYEENGNGTIALVSAFTDAQLQEMLDKIIDFDSVSNGVQIGTEVWNKHNFEEMQESHFYEETSTKPPEDVVAIGDLMIIVARPGADDVESSKDRGAAMTLKNIEVAAENVKYFDAPERDFKRAFLRKGFLSRHVFSDANTTTSAKDLKDLVPTEDRDRMLTTMLQFEILEKMSQNELPDQVLIVNEDILFGPDFARKLDEVRRQLQSLEKPWHVRLHLDPLPLPLPHII